MLVIIYMSLLFIFLLVSNEIFRRSKIMGWLAFLILPILLIPWGIYFDKNYSLFLWLKTYSVPAAACIVLLYRFSQLEHKQWLTYLLWLILALNILEAVVDSFVRGEPFMYLNAVAGIILIISIPKMNILVDNRDQKRDFLWMMPLGWIIGYTLWNWTFVYLGWTDLSVRHIPILLAPLAFEFIKPGIWFQTRAFTLGIYVILRFTYEPLFQGLSVPNFYNPLAAQIFTGVTLVWVGLYLLRHISVIIQERKTIKK